MTSRKEQKTRMTQSQVIAHMAERLTLKRSQTKEMFNHLAEIACTQVTESGQFQLPGFGKLVLSERKARQGRNPATGETIEIPARTSLKFRIGKELKTAALGLGGDRPTLPDYESVRLMSGLAGDRPTPPDYESVPDKKERLKKSAARRFKR